MTRTEAIAKAFHEAYEEQAEFYGWKPQDSTRVPWDELPTANKALMLSVVDTLLHDRVIFDVVCPHIALSDEGTGYCRLAEGQVSE